MAAFVSRTESTHYRLHEFAKTALIKIFVHPYATVCDLYCGAGVDIDKWDEAQIGHYIGIDVSSTGICEAREIWESKRKPYTADFCDLDPCMENLGSHLQDKGIPTDIVCCLQHLQVCFETEERARRLLCNVSSLLKPGGYFFGITPDSSTLWTKYQKNVEASHNKGTSMKPNIVPNCIRSESYSITFEAEEEKFPLFGKKYQLKFASDVSFETHCLVHFPSFIRLAREAGLEYVEIQNLTEFYDDNRAQFAGMLSHGGNFIDNRGRLLARSFDILGLYSTFIFQKPDPDVVPPSNSPMLHDGGHMLTDASDYGVDPSSDLRNCLTQAHHGHRPHHWDDGSSIYSKERERSGRRHQTSVDEEKNGHAENVKGILGPGPPELRFTEPY